jgi:hypothetical protein
VAASTDNRDDYKGSKMPDDAEFPADELFANMLRFLKDGGERDALFVLDVCNLSASESLDDVDPDDLRVHLEIRLSCPRQAYDILVDQEHPIRKAILRAAQAVLGADYVIHRFDVTSGAFTLPDDMRADLSDIAHVYALRREAGSATSAAKRPLLEVDETLCFVIMSFSGNPQLKDFYQKAVKPTVERMGYRCARVDEQQFNGSIRDQILTNIRQARFLVADLTEARPNCYYELGVAHALDKEVIHITRDITDVHFDIRDFNFIVYEDIDGLRRQLRKRIEVTVGKRVADP